MEPRKKLTDILSTSDRASLKQGWGQTPEAKGRAPVPRGDYVARVLGGRLFQSTKGTPGYKLALEIAEGEYAGKKLWHDIWLTKAAMVMAKRDLKKLGINEPEQLDKPLPEGIVVKARIALRREDNGTSWNRIIGFDVLRVERQPMKPLVNRE